jgi:hypothetical protein
MGKEEMWAAFWKHQWYRQDIPTMYDFQFVAWLFLPLDGVPRWVSLLSEWLGLESVREKFGTIECPNFNPNPLDVNCLNWNESCFCKCGKIRAEWAKEEK